MAKAKYTWKHLNHLLNKEGLSHSKSCHSKLLSLLNSNALQKEVFLFDCIAKRISIRLRNARVTRNIRKVKKLLSDLKSIQTAETIDKFCGSLFKEEYDAKTGTIVLPWRDQVEYGMNILAKNLKHYNLIVLHTFYTFCHIKPWLKLGHLAPHFLMMTCSLSTINIIVKAIMVYVYDLYLILYKIKDDLKQHQSKSYQVMPPKEVSTYLTSIDIKCEQESDKEEGIGSLNVSVGISGDGDVGVRVARIGEESVDRMVIETNTGKKRKKGGKNKRGKAKKLKNR